MILYRINRASVQNLRKCAVYSIRDFKKPPFSDVTSFYVLHVLVLRLVFNQTYQRYRSSINFHLPFVTSPAHFPRDRVPEVLQSSSLSSDEHLCGNTHTHKHTYTHILPEFVFLCTELLARELWKEVVRFTNDK